MIILNIKDNLKMKLLYSNKLDSKYVKKLLKSSELGKNDKISILSDSMFRTMFLNKDGIKYSAKLFSYFFDIDYKILLKKLNFYKNDVFKRKNSDINERCDFVATIDDTVINLEVNNNSSVYILQRNIDYAFRLYSESSIKVSAGYDYLQIIQLNLNNFAFCGVDDSYEIYTINNGVNILTYKLIIINVYIPNIIKKWYNQGEMCLDEMECYILGLAIEDSKQAINFGKGIDIMNEYVNEAFNKSRNELLRESYDKELALIDQGQRDGYLMGVEQGIEQGMKQGIEQGIKQGIEQATKQSKIDVAYKMLEKKLDINLISSITGLKTSDIEKLKNEVS